MAAKVRKMTRGESKKSHSYAMASAVANLLGDIKAAVLVTNQHLDLIHLAVKAQGDVVKSLTEVIAMMTARGTTAQAIVEAAVAKTPARRAKSEEKKADEHAERVLAPEPTTPAVIAVAPVVQAAPAAPIQAVPTVDELRTVFLDWTQKVGRDKAVGLLKSFGIDKLAQLPASQYVPFLEKMKAALAAPAAPATPGGDLLG